VELSGGCTSVPVADMDCAIRFYTEVLGTKLLARFGGEWACLDAGDGFLIGLVPRSEQENEISFSLYVPNALAEAVRRLRQEGLAVQESTEGGGVVAVASFRDPDGNRLSITDFPPNPAGRFARQSPDSAYRPFFDHLGLRWNTTDNGAVSVELDIRDDLRGPGGTLQGGIIATLIDVAAASTANLAGAGLVATTDMTIHYMTPGRVGPVRAVGELLHQGNRGTTVETRVYDTGRQDRFMAIALASFASLSPERSSN
jgi:uncharacterized protein (TIGR00369 family)